jgi:hypothetical protein
MHGIMHTAEDIDTSTWPGAVLALGVLTLIVFFILGLLATINEFMKRKHDGTQKDELQRVVERYEKLASTTLDAQQRFANDVAELRARTSSIEQILRSVE